MLSLLDNQANLSKICRGIQILSFLCIIWNSIYGYGIVRITQRYGVPLLKGDIMDEEKLDFSKHLSLGSNKKSDYDALKSILAEYSVEYKLSRFGGLLGLFYIYGLVTSGGR